MPDAPTGVLRRLRPSVSAGRSGPGLDWRAPALSDSGVLRTVDLLLEPLVHVLALWAAAGWVQGRVALAWIGLAVLVFALSCPGRSHLRAAWPRVVAGVLEDALGLLCVIWSAAWLAGLAQGASLRVLLLWSALTLAWQLAAAALLRQVAPWLVRLQGPPLRAVVAGLNAQGRLLADRLAASREGGLQLVGCFDDRQSERPAGLKERPAEAEAAQAGAAASGTAAPAAPRLLGHLSQLPAYVKTHRIHRIYLCLPMASQPRIRQLLDALQDTTASVYFVPDLFITDLIQGRADVVCGLPVISVCDTPFRGAAAMIKRGSDIVLASLMLLTLAPLMAVLALAVRLESPGPAIFRQRRYGLGGEEIVVYKFRSMRVCEDGERIEQARRGDARITALGRVLRRTSLDELPQLLNVLQGRMSLVGPRPHAVVHNEFYRSQIRSYMVRHKVRPGITGWAQIHGLRGETQSLEQMAARIRLDLDYLRHWSLRLDLYILLRTALLVFRDTAAY